jgi:hypothetical protein
LKYFRLHNSIVQPEVQENKAAFGITAGIIFGMGSEITAFLVSGGRLLVLPRPSSKIMALKPRRPVHATGCTGLLFD